MSEPIIHIDPDKLERLKRRFPIHWKYYPETIEALAIVKRGGADPEFVRKACYRTWDGLLSMYDLACPTEKDRQRMRRRFREMLAEYPQIDKLYPHFRRRLMEHEGWVKYGFDDPDPDEIGGGCDGTA
jgi:hypothetical protein